MSSLDACGLTLVIPIEIITLTDSLYEVTAQDVCGTMYNKFSEGNKLISTVCDTHLSPGPLILSYEFFYLEHCAHIIDKKQSRYLTCCC